MLKGKMMYVNFSAPAIVSKILIINYMHKTAQCGIKPYSTLEQHDAEPNTNSPYVNTSTDKITQSMTLAGI